MDQYLIIGVFYVLTPISIIFTYSRIFTEYRNSRFLNDSKYIMHLIVLFKCINMIQRAYLAENIGNIYHEKAKVFLFDLSICFSCWYFYLFRKLVDDSAKKHTKTHFLAILTSVGAACLHSSIESEEIINLS